MRADLIRLKRTLAANNTLDNQADYDAVIAAVAELEAARKVIAALHRWENMPGHFFGPTPKEGSEIGHALRACDELVTP
jgi:hypothetical protein